MRQQIKSGFWLCVLALCLVSGAVQAQVQVFDNRLEIPWKGADYLPFVLPAEDEGLLVFREDRSAPGRDQRWQFVFYDTAFAQQWQAEATVDRRMTLVRYEYTEQKLYMLFHDEVGDRLQILRIYPADGRVQRTEVGTLNKLEINKFVILDDRIYLAGMLRNNPFVMEVDEEEGRSKVLPSAFGGKSPEILDIYTSADAETINVVVQIDQQKRKAIVIRSYQDDQHQDFMIQPDRDYDLLNGRLAFAEGGMRVAIGTYAFKNSSNSQGFYFARFEEGEQVSTRYHSFTGLDNFFSFMTDRNEERMKARVARRKSRGKDLKLEYRLLVHDLIQRDDHFVMVGEAYYPVYVSRQYQSTPYSFYRRRPTIYQQPRLVFDGFRFTHAVIAGIDFKGDLLWDHAFELERVKTFKLAQQVRVTEDDKPLSLVYMLDDQVHYTTLQGEEVLISASEEKVSSGLEHDEVRRTESEKTAYWYGRYFLAYGYQKIRNKKDDGVDTNRKVFFINKLKY